MPISDVIPAKVSPRPRSAAGMQPVLSMSGILHASFLVVSGSGFPDIT